MIRIGFGYDVHRFAEDRALVIGGVTIPYTRGLLGHSDADVLLHAIIDAVLGAAALGDIGAHFPDDDASWKDADSMELSRQVNVKVGKAGFRVGNIDATIVMEQPKLREHIEKMRQNIANVFECQRDAVSVKATTSERMGFIGSGDGAAAYAVCTLIAE